MKIFIGIFVLALVGCSSDPNFYQTPPPTDTQAGDPPNTVEETYTITEIQRYFSTAIPADILFVIDNSYSMDYYHQEVIRNTSEFIDDFSMLPGLDYKLGLISSDLSNAPYAGFPNTGELTASTPNLAQSFKNAVAALGTNGSGIERFFETTKQALDAYPGFLRANALFNLVLITDTDDQGGLTANQFASYLTALKGSQNKVKVFGVVGPKEMGCFQSDDLSWSWPTSQLSQLIDVLLPSEKYKLCNNFGERLLEVATDLRLHSTEAEIALSHVPVAGSLTVRYNGSLLTLGTHYTFVEGTKLVKFPNLDFARNPAVPVIVKYLR